MSHSDVAYIDSHAHLYFDRFDEDRGAVIARAREAGFVHVLNVGTDAETSQAAVDLAREHAGFCFASVGLHPTSTNLESSAMDDQLSRIAGLATAFPREVVAIGEIGFDFYWDTSPRDRQEVAFRRQLALAEEVELPIIIHCRDAWPATLDVIAEHPAARGVFHCFGGTTEEARRAVDLGWYVSFAGNVSFPKAQELRDAAAVVPVERLLLETDAPFLAAQPVRGQRNEPAFALHTLATLAGVLEMSTSDVGRQTTENARRLFRFGEERS